MHQVVFIPPTDVLSPFFVTKPCAIRPDSSPPTRKTPHVHAVVHPLAPELHRRPLGVVAAIVPWNFPVLTGVNKIGAALLTGNTVVVKPAATTPLATLQFAALIKDIVPAGVVNIVTDNNDLGNVLTGHPLVRKVDRKSVV